jgi:alpha-beta hydrolase superfamily lysophospholipase
VHGFADYFFQTVAADWWVERGYDFYALDLRKYGRSWLPHQTPTYVADVTTYYEDLDAALAVVAAGHDHVVMSAHSTGGLTGAAVAARPAARGGRRRRAELSLAGDEREPAHAHARHQGARRGRRPAADAADPP